MPPNPINRARSEFYGEPEEPEFFVPTRGRTSFSPYISPRFAANSRMQMNKFLREEDDAETRASENYTRRLESASRSRLMPYSERAQMAQNQLQEQRAQSDMRLNPFMEKQEQAQSEFATAQARGNLQNLPQAQKLDAAKMAYEQSQMQRADPREEEIQRLTKSPESILAYRHFLKTADPKLPREDQMESAYNQALQLDRDRGAVETVYEAYSNGNLDADSISQFVESVDAPDGTHLGMRIKNAPNVRARIAQLAADERTYKQKMEREREESKSSRYHNAQLLATLNDEISDLRKQIEIKPTPELEKELNEARKQRAAIKMKMLGSGETEKSSGGTDGGVDTFLR